MAKAMSKAKNISAGVGAKGKKAPMVV